MSDCAAGLVGSLGLAELCKMLTRATVTSAVPGATLALLSRSGPRGADDARQASMVQVLQWSWQQLTSDEQNLHSALAACEVPG